MHNPKPRVALNFRGCVEIKSSQQSTLISLVLRVWMNETSRPDRCLCMCEMANWWWHSGTATYSRYETFIPLFIFAWLTFLFLVIRLLRFIISFTYLVNNSVLNNRLLWGVFREVSHHTSSYALLCKSSSRGRDITYLPPVLCCWPPPLCTHIKISAMQKICRK